MLDFEGKEYTNKRKPVKSTNMLAIFHKSCKISIFYLLKTGNIVVNLMNERAGKNPKLLIEHAGNCANIVGLKCIFINQHVLLLDR